MTGSMTDRRPALALRRLYLRCVGPAAARYDPLDLNLATPDGPAADKALLALTNTGGKTTLLRLLTSVVVPNAREQMGGANIGEYVQTGDTAHVLLEWESATAGRYVVGGCYEWPGRTRPRDVATGGLTRAFYTFRVTDDFDITSLPFLNDGRRRTLDDYRVALSERFRSDANARYRWERTQADWATTLNDETEIDPELFRYQMRMNDAEGGAERLIAKLNSADAVVKFFVSALNDRDVTSQFTKTLATYATAAGARSELELDLEFSEAMSAHLLSLADAADFAAAASADVAGRAMAAGELAGAIVTRSEQEEARKDRAAEDRDRLAGEQTETTTEVNRYEAIRAQLRLEEARFQLAAAETAEEAAQGLVTSTERSLRIAEALEPVARWRAAQASEAAVRAAHALAESDLAPLRDAMSAAGGRFASKLQQLTASSAATGRREADRARTLRDENREAETQRRAAAKAVTDADGELAAIAKVTATAKEATADLRVAGYLDPGEGVGLAVERWASVLAATEADRQTARRRVTEIDSQLKGKRKALSLRRSEVEDAKAQVRQAEDELARYQAELADLRLFDDIAAVLGDSDDIDIAGLQRAVEQLNRSASRAEGTAAAADVDLDGAQRELDILERDDLLATSADVLAVWECLVTAGIPAVTGWAWIAQNIEAVPERQRLIAERPDVVDGVIVTDPTRLAAAQETVDHAALDLRTAVLVTTAPSGPGRTDGGFVVEPHRAVYDQEWAAETADALRQRIDELTVSAKEQRATAQRIRRAVSDTESFCGRWVSQEADLVPAVATAQAHLAERAALLDEAVAAVDGLETDQAELRERLEGLVDHVRDADRALAQCRSCLKVVEQAAQAADTRQAMEDRRGQAAERERRLDREIEDRERLREAAVKAQSDAESEVGRWRDRLDAVGHEPAGDPGDASVDELDADFRAKRAAFTAKDRGSELDAQLTNAEERTAQAAKDVSRFDVDVIEAAQVRVRADDAGTPERRAALRDEADGAHRAAQRRHIEAEDASQRARDTVDERTPPNRASHIVLTDDWVPADVAACVRLVAKAEGDAGTARERLRALDTAHQQAVRIFQQAEHAQAMYAAHARVWAGDVIRTGDVFTGSSDEAALCLEERIAVWRSAEATAREAADERGSALDEVRECARDERWPGFAIADRCRKSTPEDLFASARELAGQLSTRLSGLRADLEDLNRHRDSLVTQLHGLADTQLRLLRAVTNSSKIPDGFGDLSGNSAFRIEFDRADANEARARLASRVDTWSAELAEDPRRANRSDRVDGWLADAARDLVRPTPTGATWRVKVLKPVIDGAVQYCTPDRVEREYSGGQELTLAVLLYCCLADVRSRNRSGGGRPPGALLLDNPFGKASNGRLIGMQQALAAKSGIQLVCATGLNDPTVITAFEGSRARLVRLRNDIDQRRGLHHIRIEDPVAAKAVEDAVTNGRDPEDPNGYVSAVGYTVKDPAD